MNTFLITFKSGNRKTGPILVTTSPRATCCPIACPLRENDSITCATCRICLKQCNAIIAFPAHGAAAHKIAA
jgi:hypothetical protein